MAKVSQESHQGKKLVIVESPTKARTIRKFLDHDFVVESCMGHIRDLPQSAKDIPERYKKEPWAHLGVNVEKGFQPLYCIPKNKTRVVKTLKEKLGEVDELILATDEDREGESISWHLVEVLHPKIPVKRMVFHEITKEAIQGALKKFRTIDEHLVRAQEARRILDRLVGYTLSPLLWKKVAYGLSAGRVQSVAVRLIAEKEHERMRFKKSLYSTVEAQNRKNQILFESRLHSFQDQRLATGRDFDGSTGELLAEKKSQVRHLQNSDAAQICQTLKGQTWRVEDVEEKPISRKPQPPFITSTLQQESNRKLGLSSRETMDIAQKLYERGFITYMRTDSPSLSQQALQACREVILDLYGEKYLSQEVRDYSGKKSKGAQEAHEAIRPAGVSFVSPSETGLSGLSLKLYELIWKRTIASQMVNAQQKQMSVKFKVGEAIFAASGMTVEFPGYLKAYADFEEENSLSEDQRETPLPALKVGDQIECLSLSPSHHETKPPARYTEASLIQTLEREGVGRPSTYSTIMSTIQDRGYVKKVGNALVPTFTALVVIKLLSHYLPNYVDLKFTSSMEERLDDIANGDLEWVKYLTSLYFGDHGLKEQVALQDKTIKGENSRSIFLEGLEGLSFRIGRYGAYVCRQDGDKEVCASLPENQFPGDITAEIAHKLIDQKIAGADALGQDPQTGLPVYVLSGRYGPYVQLGEMDTNSEVKPKRMSIPPTLDPQKITLTQALALLSLPERLGAHPETGQDIKKGLGRFGPYVVHDGDFRSIPKTDDLFTVDLKRALELLAQPKRSRGRAAPLRDLGLHPGLQQQIQLFNGKYGLYIKVGKVNASVPDDIKAEDVTLDQALQIVADRLAFLDGKKKSKGKNKGQILNREALSEIKSQEQNLQQAQSLKKTSEPLSLKKSKNDKVVKSKKKTTKKMKVIKVKAQSKKTKIVLSKKEKHSRPS